MMMRPSRPTLTAIAVILAAGCGVPPNHTDAGPADAGPADAGEPDAGDVDAGPVYLNQIQDQIFTPSCSTGACHNVNGIAGDLVLLKGQSYAGEPGNPMSGLVNVAPANSAAAMAGELRVKPGSLSESFLWVKLTGPSGDEGAPMPSMLPPLPADQLDLVKRWIEGGALCMPYACADLMQACGTSQPDGCGGTHNCGECP